MRSKFLREFKELPYLGHDTFFGLEINSNFREIDAGILGIPFDFGASFRVGQRFAPMGIRRASRIISGVDYFLRNEIFNKFRISDLGDINIQLGHFNKIIKSTERFLDNIPKKLRIVYVGGDHSITYPIISSLYRRNGKINLIHFDAHIDVWDSLYSAEISHASWLSKLILENKIESLLQIGLRGSYYSTDDFEPLKKIDYESIDMKKIRRDGIESVINAINRLKDFDNLYISLDIDVIDPAFAPGTGIPEPGGLTSWEILEILRNLEVQPLGFDITEVIPAYDISEITQILAANIIFIYLSRILK